MINPLEIVVDGDEDEGETGQSISYTVLTRTISTLKAFMVYYSPVKIILLLMTFMQLFVEDYYL